MKDTGDSMKPEMRVRKKPSASSADRAHSIGCSAANSVADPASLQSLGNPVTKRGVNHLFSGYQPGIQQHSSVTPEGKGHPILEGLEGGLDIVDETYHCPYFEDSITPLLRTDFEPKAENFQPAQRRDPTWNPAQASNLSAWYKSAENSPIVYIQHGHDNLAWSNAGFQKLMGNAIKWAASEKAMKWAKDHPSEIFHD